MTLLDRVHRHLRLMRPRVDPLDDLNDRLDHHLESRVVHEVPDILTENLLLEARQVVSVKVKSLKPSLTTRNKARRRKTKSIWFVKNMVIGVCSFPLVKPLS